MISLNYPDILMLLKEHLAKGRAESASFLMWYLQNYYRLDLQEAVDSVCDQKGDKGVDGIYINEANSTIDVFQTRIIQNPTKTIGDKGVKEFYGTLSQFESKEALKNLIDTGGDAQVVELINRLNIMKIFDQYKIRGIFISNVDLDSNGEAYLSKTPLIEFLGKSQLESTYISDSRTVPQNVLAEFDITGLNISKHFVDSNTLALIVPIKANELVKMTGISDQSIFAYNVRGPLGGTNVNRDIVRSIKDKSLHKKFPLFHNGITIVTNELKETDERLSIKTFFVVNGCQSLTALYNHKKDLSDDLRILTKFVQVSVDGDLAKKITEYSNNQNGVKPRDFKANNAIQVRLQNEFTIHYGHEYFYEIKRGEDSINLKIISNELAGIHLMSFDLKEPWGTHRKYQVFEDKYTELFGKPEITSHRILMLHLIDKIIISKLSTIKNELVAKYALTRFAIMYMLREILETDPTGKILLLTPEIFILKVEDRNDFIQAISQIIDDIITDFNSEVENLGADFDYKSKLRDEIWVKDLSTIVVNIYQKLVKRKTIPSFDSDWKKRITSRVQV